MFTNYILRPFKVYRKHHIHNIDNSQSSVLAMNWNTKTTDTDSDTDSDIDQIQNDCKNISLALTTWSDITETHEISIFKQSYLHIAPINMTLGVLIVFLNSLVVSHYYKNRSKVTCTLLLLISISDIATALGHIVFSVGVILWSKNTRLLDKMMWWCLVTFRVAGLLGYCSSILFNTLLAVLRTIKIYNPFYSPRLKPVVAFGLGYISVLIALTGFDMYTFHLNPTFLQVLTLWFFITPFEEMYVYPGQTIAWTVFIFEGFGRRLSTIVQFAILSLISLIPVLTTLASMIVQIYIGYQRSRNRGSDTAVVINDWAHVNTTVFLLATVFFVCNSSLSLATLITYFLSQHYDPANDIDFCYISTLVEVQSAATSLLPLLNAFLTPVIIIGRNRQLLQEIIGRLRLRIRD